MHSNEREVGRTTNRPEEYQPTEQYYITFGFGCLVDTIYYTYIETNAQDS
jgi:hypothetical protein